MFQNAHASLVAVVAVLLSAGGRANAQLVFGEPTNLNHRARIVAMRSGTHFRLPDEVVS